MTRLSCLIACVILLLGCVPRGIDLAAPPNLYSEGTNFPSEAVPPVLRTVEPRMFYVTDRAPEFDGDTVTGYSTGRSTAMGFGAARVRYGAANWEDLVARTHVDQGGRLSSLDVLDLQEMVRFNAVPFHTLRTDGRLIFVPEQERAYQERARDFQRAVQREIARTGNRRILVYVHGVNNQFEDSLTTLANFWHYAGRTSIPIAFTWPAGNRGALGYFRDREAGDFSVYHAKEFLRLLAEIPQVEDIDIVAHSRGTDVMTKALRELVIYNRGRGLHPKTAMKTGTLILAAADLDIGVVQQRLQAERFSEAFEQINIYTNPNDSALRLSSILTSVPRVGALSGGVLRPEELARLRKSELVHFIRVEGLTGRGHSYFRQNPAVLSDIVLALRTRAFPGGTLRPLEQGPEGVWELHPNYPLDRLPMLDIEVPR